MIEPKSIEGEATKVEIVDAGDAAAREMSAAPRWGLLPTLAWIGLRDVSKALAALPNIADYGHQFGPFGRAAWLCLSLRDTDGAVELEPIEALLRELRAGEVFATGRRNGLTEVDRISPEQWDALGIVDGPKGKMPGSDYVMRQDWKPGQEPGDYWADVRFDRPSVMATFPDTTHTAAVITRGSTRTELATNPSNLAAASACFQKRENRKPGRRELARELSRLADVKDIEASAKSFNAMWTTHRVDLSAFVSSGNKITR